LNRALSVHDDDPLPELTVEPAVDVVEPPPAAPAPAADPPVDDPAPARERFVDVELALARRFDDVFEDAPEPLPADPEREDSLEDCDEERDDPLDCEAPLDRDERDREDPPDDADPERDVERRLLDPLAPDREDDADPASAVVDESRPESSSLRHALGSGMPEVRFAT